MHFKLICFLAIAAFNVDALRIRKINHNNDENEVSDSNGMFYQRQDLGFAPGEDEMGEENVMEKRAASPVTCGRPTDAVNVNITNAPKTQYNVGDIITYKCAKSYMRVVDGSLQITCKSNGQWEPRPVCQSYTFGCRRTKLAREYKGKLATTRCGYQCQPWSVNTPQKPAPEVRDHYNDSNYMPEYKNIFDAQNYCRNPDPGETSGPWCYVNSTSTRWDYCDVNYCDGFDVLDEYDRFPGACGCQGEWFNNYGNIKDLEKTTLLACKYECDNTAQCQGIVFDEYQNKCWLKKCSCSDREVTCGAGKHETYYRKKTPPCPGVETWDRYNQRHCYYSLYNFNLNSTLLFDWQTSRKLCQDLFPLPSDMLALETDDEWDFLANNIAQLRIPLAYNRLWLGLARLENVSDSWSWVNNPSAAAFSNGYQPPLNYSRWAPEEPTNGYEEQCAQVVLAVQTNENRQAIGRWTDESCRIRAPVICEAKMPNFRTTKREDGAEEKPEPKKFHPRCKTDPCPTYDDDK